jgi:hypothetical protein
MLIAVLTMALCAPSLPAEKTKSLSGKVRRVEGNLLTIKKSGLVSTSEVQIELTDDTKTTGQVAPGMHVKVKYREEKNAAGETRLIALEIVARPEYASKEAKKLAKDQQTKP